MTINTLISSELTFCHHSGRSKKRILEFIAEEVVKQHPEMDTHALFSALINREKLGSTGIGKGIAIPHCRQKDCQQPIAVFITLSEAIEFNAIDNQNVDIVIALIVPDGNNQQHLKMLASIAETFSKDDVLTNVRNTTDKNDLIKLLQS